VVSGKPTGRPWVDRVFDLRIEDHAEPLEELRRLLLLARAYREMNAGDEAMTVNDVDAAVARYDAAATMVPESAEMVYWAGITLASVGRVDEALPRLERAYAADPGWAVLTARLPEAGLLPDDSDLLSRLLSLPGGLPGMGEWHRLAAEGNAPAFPMDQ
jgi:tetratricopeptide (TPR) repeat protein